MVILGLGSNKGDRDAHLKRAVERLSGVLKELRASSIYETPALLPENAPGDWDRKFLNMAVMGETDLPPLELLACIKTIEREMGRTPAEVWAPREIDIDILAIDGLVLDLPQVSVPHRGLLERAFALLPLAELAPDWPFPRPGDYLGKTAMEICAAKDYSMAAEGKISHG